MHATALLATCVRARASGVGCVWMCGREQCRPYETPLNSNVNGNNDLKFYLEVDERAAGAHARTRVSTQSTPCEYREYPV